MAERRRPVRIANCSGFYGDSSTAARELLDGPDAIDVLTGDYLAELTMLILWKAQRDGRSGYAATFLRQLEDVLGACSERGVKIVANAGGLDPRGLAAEVDALAERLGLRSQVAVIDGDDLTARIAELQAAGHELRHLDTGQTLADAGAEVVTANAYLGGWGIAAALEGGADVVVCPRVTDAALVVGPAAWWHGWAREDWDRLAGAVVAGHILECGTQTTGGNYPFLDEVPAGRRPGFPIAEIHVDGSGVITKQPGTGGVVNVGTVTAQLLYEIGQPAYANPDVVARFDTVCLTQEAPDRVRYDGVRGEPAPRELKVAVNFFGGFRNSMTMVLTGLDVEAKAAHAQSQLWEGLGGRDTFDEAHVELVQRKQADPETNAEATSELRVTVMDRDATKVGRRFSTAVTGLTLASYAGFYTTTPPSSETAFGVYWPCLVPAEVVTHRVTLPDGVIEVPHSPPVPAASIGAPEPPAPWIDDGPTVRAPLGTVCGARSGDKGGNANVGLWVRSIDAYRWLAWYLTDARLRKLLPEAAELEIRRYDLPNVLAVNLVVVGLLGAGVASSARHDPQAKGLGEYLRCRLVDVPEELMTS